MARSFRPTIFIDPQLATVGTAKGQPLSGCFLEQSAPNYTNFTLNVLLNYLLLQKE